LLDAEGQQQWAWQIGGDVQDIWAYEAYNDQFVFLILTDDKRVIEVKSGEQDSQVIELDGQVTGLSHRYSATNHQWTAIVMSGGVVDWLSWSPFRIIQDNRVTLDFEIRQIEAVYDPQRSNALVALGLTTEGQLFSLNDQEVELYPTPSIRRLVLDPSGRFMFWLLGEQIEVYRNPAISQIDCKVDYVSVNGTLTVDAFDEICVNLKNTGIIHIYRIGTQQQGDNRIEPCGTEKQSRILPGELIKLKFAVRAIAAGAAVPLDLHIELEDEAGPPISRDKFTFTVESKER